MPKQKFFPVAAQGDKYKFSAYIRKSRGYPGVYIVKGKKGGPVYIGHSTYNVYKMLTRHFHAWPDDTQKRVTYKNRGAYRVRIVLTKTGAQALRLERALIVKYKPRDNPDKLEKFMNVEQMGKAEKKALDTYLSDDVLSPTDNIPF